MSVPSTWILDTNIVLDVWVFNDPLVQPLRQALGLPLLDGDVAQAEAADAAGEETATSASTSVVPVSPADDASIAPAEPVPAALVRPRWLATAVMREELTRVLAYPHLVRRQALDQRVAEQVLAAYDRAVTLCPVAPKARFTCTDADDQKFIDLAAAHACPPPLTVPTAPPSVVLVSKDKAVLRLKKRLVGLGVLTTRHWPGP